jgi:ribosomal protein S18 acetylase RimI-like enzyme
MLSRLTFEWDAERRILDLSDVKTHVDHRGNGHARSLLSALVDVLLQALWSGR